LTASDVSFRYGERKVLSGVDLRLGEGEVAVLLGPNGAGKSTLLKLFSGLLLPDSGEVSLVGLSPASYGRREMARLLSVVSQDPPLDFPMSVEEYVMLGRFPHHGFFGAGTAEDVREVERALAMTGLADLRGRGLREISAGERQRASVARAIGQGARVMLLDEPTAYLDIYHRVAFYEIVTRLAGGIARLVALRGVRRADISSIRGEGAGPWQAGRGAHAGTYPGRVRRGGRL
jgi:iron complex transport system ATP-binding protein